MKKTAAILLCLCMLLGMASCSAGSEDHIPEGMQIASCAGADYYLYVPTSWNLNTTYGVSGAYFSLDTLSNVSVQKYEQTEVLKSEMQANGLERSGDRIEWYFANYCSPLLESASVEDSYVIRNEELGISYETTFGGENARQYRVQTYYNGQTIQMLQVIAERRDAFYVFTFMAADSLYDSLWTAVEAMISYFQFTDTPYYPEEYSKEIDPNAEAPAGMKLASNKEVAYLFYVPADWALDQYQRVFAAYCSDCRASVSIVPYMLDNDVTSMSIDEFFSASKAELESVGTVEMLTAEPNKEAKLGGVPAYAYRYRFTMDGRSYEYYQVIAPYKGMFYSLTYTAPDQATYTEHLDEVKQIISVFEFR